MQTATLLARPDAAPPTALSDDPPVLSPLRAAIVAACRRPEAECLAPLLDLAELPSAAAARAEATARRLVERLRSVAPRGGVEGLIHEYDLSSAEGVALMCLAEALLRIPDAATRDALIRDKIAPGDWAAHLGRSPSTFVNAATWGLLVTGRLTATASEAGLSAALTRLIGRGGEPLIRRGVDLAMRLMGEQFVLGQTIADAVRRARLMEAKGFTHSYDMLGEAATTAEDAARYRDAYEAAIHAIGQASAGRGIHAGPGISIKLSALHPRYVRAKRGRVMAELLPRVQALARLAKGYGIGLNIDAEEADRLDLSLDILEALAADPALAGWNGLGFVVQAYGRRCPFVIDWLVDLGRRTRRRLMVRLVKGAYWDSEIKRAQVDGLADFPVFTRKAHTDVSYLACARKLLDAPDAVFPQFATHNAATLAAIVEMGGPDFHPGDYEFQCLHGMGEPLYEAVVGAGTLDRPCRIYAPVGTHETLLAYLVRRLLENGANSSFVNRIADADVPVEELIADPVAAVRAMPAPGAPHPRIAPPRDLFGPARPNAAGLDLADEAVLAGLAQDLRASAAQTWTAVPSGRPAGDADTVVRNPADHDDVVGHVRDAGPADVARALAAAEAAAPGWAATPAADRADALRRAADAFEARMPILLGLIVREAGKTLANAVAEVREAVDFLRYYAGEAERVCGAGTRPLGPVVCIAPWNFPLAIFTGQVAAALAAGNTVLAKPAEETPLVAAEAVRLLHAAGVPTGALHLVPGAGEVGAALVGDPRVQGVMFTGSTAVARLIHRELAGRLTPDGRPVPLVAETGGQNAMVVDSSALPEQVVADVVISAFDSAGQRCSALRILCLQEDIAERVLVMLRGAMRELETGDPRRLAVDLGPVITAEAAEGIARHVAAMRGRGHAVIQADLPPEAGRGTFVPPTLIEIERIADVEAEVFGPVLHVLRYPRDGLDALVDAINATGYGLTFGLHTRIEETVARVLDRVEAGNLYVNRNMVGAVVGVQPFGGSGLSGTGPKAGGPLYLRRLLAEPPEAASESGVAPADPAAAAYAAWLGRRGHAALAERVAADARRAPLGTETAWPGPVGERNSYALRPRGRIAAVAAGEAGALLQVGAILATGNDAVLVAPAGARNLFGDLPGAVAARVGFADDLYGVQDLRGVLYEGDADALMALNRRLADRAGPILPVRIPAAASPSGSGYDLLGLVEERSVSVNTAAAGGNASLMSLDG
ncbi:trifunctional transcriptional regulator/proline dehydrogenase/L-glutamate gamma-semialdehyde dehydrogenase [Methylobacterium sp. NEAU 140]|uniref:trifunctional transcriptional regulator/proline dehydrogenase/L-glutamate gamma-semialdehyde dehydrogenase n=1 Tax=Methylobacterium sp. NEAU 140 TaxID=3064945 RepID=UPI0027346ABD|nr:trifunctional transcriptional regulator/proline dehydrogenase/L-glutamate gamma-semialdehyde dehydrogenase [Methylobacterium sp. NEAU 140]MDP4023987.1 trifunctional transcriptional regulator/proline dehydrogenase/L-glutamate gamma-semialdehyde dehydrogenase [Methylobacterium sp. NEAU 140]